MVLPITKTVVPPVVMTMRNVSGSIGYTFLRTETRYEQQHPIDRPLPYSLRQQKIEVIRNTDNYWVTDLREPNFKHREELYNKAYAKFVEKVLQGSRVELGMNVATAALTAKLLAGAVTAFTRFDRISEYADRLNRFAYTLQKAVHEQSPKRRAHWRRKAAKYLGCAPTTQAQVDAVLRRQVGRDGIHLFSAEYLAFHYGWSPLFGDMWRLLQQLQEGYTLNEVSISAGSRVRISQKSKTPGLDWVFISTGYSCAKIGAIAQVENEVLFVLNRTGLINPAIVAWDVVKFSFVADWLMNFGQMFAAPTDFVGVRLNGIYTTNYDDYVVEEVLHLNHRTKRMKTHGFMLERATPSSVPLPNFVLKIPFSGSWRRGLAQISLLALFGIKPKTSLI